jgi:hypothetical protein
MARRDLNNRTRRALDPRRCSISIDANALDRNGTTNDQLVDRFVKLSSTGHLNIVVSGGVRDEVLHPHTPGYVKAAVLPKIFNLRPGLNSIQQTERRRIHAILQGKAKPNKHAADASHLSEAAETGCSYFITNDQRFLNKQAELHAALPPTLTIVTLAEFLDILDDFEAGRRL